MKKQVKNTENTNIVENKSNAQAFKEKRTQLVELSRQLKAQSSEDVSINNLLLAYYRQQFGITCVVKTREQWEHEGYKVVRNKKRYAAWGKPITATNKQTGEEYTFYPLTHFYEESEVEMAQ